MKEKPPILKLKKLPERIFEYGTETIAQKMCYTAGWKDGTEAQRDTDVAWCEQAKAEVAREIRFQILEWFRNYAHQLDRKFPHPTTEEQGWLGNIWDMIHMAGKEDFEGKCLKEE